MLDPEHPRRVAARRRLRAETGWIIAGALALWLAQRPYPALPLVLQAWLPALLILFAPALVLVAFARHGGVRQAALLAAIWWGLGGIWLVHVDPRLGVFAWLGMVAFSITLTVPLGLLLRLLRERHGADVMLWLAPFAWTGWELARSWTPIGCPWFSLAHSFWRLPVLLQVCELTGYRGLTLVVAMFSAGIARVLLRLPGAGRQLAVGGGLLLAVVLYGVWRLPRLAPDASGPIPTALIQPNVPQDLKSNGSVLDLVERHLALTRQVPPGTKLVAWPETAVPAPYLAVPEIRARLVQTARRLNATLILGGVETIEPGDSLTRNTNAAFVMAPDGRIWDVYHKVHLVILGEYLPARNTVLVSWLARMTPQYFAGSRYRAVNTPVGRLGIPICYESAFAGDCRTMVRDGAEALVALTNDDQLTETGARELLQQTVFRSVETRRWLARCANSGISCVISPTGELVAQSRWDVPMIESGSIHLRRDVTLYTRYGDWLPWACLLAVAAALVAPRRREAR